MYRGAPAEAEQPLGSATRVETPDAEGGHEMNGTEFIQAYISDQGNFKL